MNTWTLYDLDAERRHLTRRMLQALDGYWLHCDGLPRDRYPRSRSDAEDWWTRFESYRKKLEALPDRASFYADSGALPQGDTG